jgi:hypothetical protein
MLTLLRSTAERNVNRRTLYINTAQLSRQLAEVVHV